MKCPKCEFENKIGVRFCGKCSFSFPREEVKTNDLFLFSTQFSGGGVSRLSPQTISDSISGFSKVSMAFGYYDSDFCKKILEGAKIHWDQSELRIIFNALKGQRLKFQCEELKLLKTELEKRFSKVEIKLCSAKGIFHTKLIICQAEATGIVFLGSANLTPAAYSINEEIFLRIQGPLKEFSNYYNSVWSGPNTRNIEEIEETPADSLINFFRTGSLFFQPKSSIQFGLNPFSEFLNTLSDTEKRKLGSVPLPHSEASTGIGAFNMKKAMGLTENSLAEDENKQSRFSIKPYSIETCLGFWVPEFYNEELSNKLDEVKDTKKSYYVDFFEKFSSLPQSEIDGKFIEYLDFAFNEFKMKNIDFRPYFSKKAIGEPFEEDVVGEASDQKNQDLVVRLRQEIDHKFEIFIVKFGKDLRNNELIDRICKPFVESILPEIWDDSEAFEEFKSSFFEYLEFLSSKFSKKMGKVPRTIFDKLMISGEASKEEIEKRLIDYIGKNGWGADDW